MFSGFHCILFSKLLTACRFEAHIIENRYITVMTLVGFSTDAPKWGLYGVTHGPEHSFGNSGVFLCFSNVLNVYVNCRL